MDIALIVFSKTTYYTDELNLIRLQLENTIDKIIFNEDNMYNINYTDLAMFQGSIAKFDDTLHLFEIDDDFTDDDIININLIINKSDKVLIKIDESSINMFLKLLKTIKFDDAFKFKTFDNSYFELKNFNTYYSLAEFITKTYNHVAISYLNINNLFRPFIFIKKDKDESIDLFKFSTKGANFKYAEIIPYVDNYNLKDLYDLSLKQNDNFKGFIVPTNVKNFNNLYNSNNDYIEFYILKYTNQLSNFFDNLNDYIFKYKDNFIIEIDENDINNKSLNIIKKHNYFIRFVRNIKTDIEIDEDKVKELLLYSAELVYKNSPYGEIQEN